MADATAPGDIPLTRCLSCGHLVRSASVDQWGRADTCDGVPVAGGTHTLTVAEAAAEGVDLTP